MIIRLHFICCLVVAGAAVAGLGCSPGAADQGGTSTPQVSDATSQEAATVPSQQTGEDATPAPSVREDSVATQEPPAATELIGWDALDIGMQADVVYRPFFLQNNPRTDSLNGKRVRIGGFIHGGVARPNNLQEFILLKNNRCKYGPGGQADHLIRVFVKKGVRVDFTTKMVYVEGVLTLHPDQGPDGNTWSLYDLEGDAFSSRKRL